jgi:predicted nucleic acid-binding protein
VEALPDTTCLALQFHSRDTFYGFKIVTTAHDRYMLDTNVFNAVADGKVAAASFANHRLLVTGIQADELRATKTAERREELLAIYKEISPTPLPASTFAFNIEGAGFDQAHWNDGSGTFEKMLSRLQQLDPTSKNLLNQLRDILIAETAIKNKTTLVSGDSNLRQVASEFGGHAVNPDDPCPNGGDE